MIVTGQHSFSFSAVSGGESGVGLLEDSSGSLSFADLLGKSEAQYGLALNRDENRDIEILSESVLNENNGYQVVVGENGSPVTEIKGMTENSSQAVTDAGAPDSDSESGCVSVCSAKKTDTRDDAAEEKDGTAVHGGASEENGEPQPEKAAVQSPASDSVGKEFSKKSDAVKNALQEQKSALTEKVFAVAGKDGVDGNLKTASAVAAANGEKTSRPEKNVAEKGKESDGGKGPLRGNGGDVGADRSERVITVSVLRADGEKSENKPVVPGIRKINATSSGNEEKTVSTDKGMASSDTISSLISSSAKETGGIEKAITQNISKADLVKELKEQGSIEILREAKILVKDGQSGEIKLVLRPQELGTVKINLILENKHIVGKIFVDNNIVKEALQTAFGDLKEIFAEQGMELGALDVFVSQQSQQENLFSGDDGIDITPLKMAHAVGAVEKHAGTVVRRFDRSAIDIEV